MTPAQELVLLLGGIVVLALLVAQTVRVIRAEDRADAARLAHCARCEARARSPKPETP